MTSTKKHIVLITTWFPPIQGVAVNRMTAFAKYLDKSKYEVTVLTLLEKDSLVEEEMFGCKVKRFSNDRILKLPQFSSTDKKIQHYLKVAWKLSLLKIQKDIYSSWRKKVIAELSRMYKISKIDVLISSFSPEASHVIACEFCEEHPAIHWIADMRDEMSQSPIISSQDKKKYLKIERRINQLASAFTTVSQPLVDLLRSTTLTDVKSFEEIRNGFDHEIEIPQQVFNPVFTITYCGIFYGYHKPDIFFEALEELKQENQLPEPLRLKFVGTARNIKIPTSLEKHVEFVERVPQEESISHMIDADANLFMIPKSTRQGVYTGKLFDYLSVKRPIIAIVDRKDVAAKLISEMNAGFIASNENVQEIKKAILDAYSLWKNKEQLKMNEEGIKSLHRKFQIEKLNKLIGKILNEN